MMIRDLVFPEGAGLAPMAGVTDAVMRQVCFAYGAAWAVTEMLSAKGWVYSKGKNKNAGELLVKLPGSGITGLQLFGREPFFVAEAAGQLQDNGFSFIDLNFGCPAPQITGNGEGSAMMLEPELIGRVITAVASRVKLPVTAKIRSGWDEEHINAVEVARICEDSGASAITVHGRTRAQQYSGTADWGMIGKVKAAVNIPVIGNGDIFSAEDAVRMLNKTGCDAVMIGRAARGNPWIFAQVRSMLNGEEPLEPSANERQAVLVKHIKSVYDRLGKKRGMLEMRKHVAWYVSNMPSASRFRERINSIEDPDRMIDAVIGYFEEQG